MNISGGAFREHRKEFGFTKGGYFRRVITSPLRSNK